jgi:hypothetical protein
MGRGQAALAAHRAITVVAPPLLWRTAGRRVGAVRHSRGARPQGGKAPTLQTKLKTFLVLISFCVYVTQLIQFCDEFLYLDIFDLCT